VLKNAVPDHLRRCRRCCWTSAKCGEYNWTCYSQHLDIYTPFLYRTTKKGVRRKE